MVLEVALAYRSSRDPVLAEGLGRASLEQLRSVAEGDMRAFPHGGVEIRVGVEIDEARCNAQVAPLDQHRASGAQTWANGGDETVGIDEHV